MPRTIPAACSAVLLLAAALGVPAPAVAHAPGTPDLIREEVIAEADSDAAASAGGTAKVNRLDRSPSGLTVLTWTMHNQGPDSITFAGDAIGYTYLYQGAPHSGITVLDTEAQTRYHPLMDEEARCLCSAGRGKPPEFVSVIGANRYSTYHSTFLLPESVEEVTVEIPGFAPVTEVPVSDL